MLEKVIERKFVNTVEAMGGIAFKFTSPGCNGVPDRLVLLPDGKMAFVELKAPGQTLRPLQERRKYQIEKLGFRVYCINDPQQIGGVLNAIQTT